MEQSFMELAKERFSVRKYQDKAVEKVKLDYILEAARVSPSAVNFQPWHFIVIREDVMREKVASTYHRDWINQAPVLIAVCGDHSQSWHRQDGKDFCDIDVATAIVHMMLAAVEEGLGTCWVGNFEADRCHQLLELSSEEEVIALLPVGYPASEAGEKKRKEIHEIVSWI
ncbi:nitroreductase [Iocasia frigidifontis]|uniref:Nitroreductase n=1 Tax=Iocasia fonsfrigidae TaxID=2682810 RepID=A0A8A7KL96_9FIRM|nr:nitroreductase family protein [Iocasia fonsfrigidae]QTL98622.1 nitroreductase [Iocasia fonsfrigidae]